MSKYEQNEYNYLFTNELLVISIKKDITKNVWEIKYDSEKKSLNN